MAKLTDVKVLDMQGGKVMRVSYAGAEYVRTEDAAVAGDIVQRRHKYDTEYATGGEFYVAYNAGGMRVYDNDDDVEYHTEAWRTFRKQSAATTTPDLTQRVDAIDARVSALEEVKQAQHTRPITSYDDLEVGMTLKCVKRCSDFTVGNTYKIVDKDSDGDFEVVSDGGRRKHVTTYRQRGTRTERFEIVSGGYPTPAPTKPAFKVGDYAKVATGRARMYDLSGGEIVKLAFNDGCYDFRAHSVSRIADELCDVADLEPATDAEVAQAKRAAKFTALGRTDGELRQGDLVRVTRTKGSGDGIHVGQLLETTVDGDENSVGVLSGWRVAADLVAPIEARVDAN